MNEKFLIKGKTQLMGEVSISGSKNSALAVLAATLLTSEVSIIENVPKILDVLNLLKIFKQIGVEVEFLNSHKVKITPTNLEPEKIPLDLFEKMRASVLLIPPLLHKFDQIKIPHPGGDRIGLRPITSHVKVFKSFDIQVKNTGKFYILKRPKKLEGRKIVLDEFSVTATENAIMLASLCEGKTRIEMAAAEPHVQDLGEFLKKMGLKISGTGTHSIEIEGEKRLYGASFKISPDPIETGTFLIAFAITGGEGKIENTNPEHLTFFLEKMKEIGVKFEIKGNSISVKTSKNFKATKIQSLPYPGFPTDLQPQTSVLLTQAKGKSLIHEPLYENRFSHLHQLRKMGADIEITDPHRALIFGKTPLKATKLDASDIRSGAALVLAALIADGESEIENIWQIDRGYENFDEKLKKLGAKIERIK